MDYIDIKKDRTGEGYFWEVMGRGGLRIFRSEAKETKAACLENLRNALPSLGRPPVYDKTGEKPCITAPSRVFI